MFSLLILTLSLFSLEEKVGQLLVVHFPGEVYNESAEKLIREVHVGGIIYYNWANGLHSPEQIRALSSSLQKQAKIPLFIAVDQEGGRIVRLKKGFTPFPSNAVFGEIDDSHLVEQCAYLSAQEASEVGFNLILAPVVDIVPKEGPSAIGDRSYGSSPDKVARLARSALSGYKRGGVISCLKHYPGIGSSHIDSHLDLPVTTTDDRMLYQLLLPHSQMVMTGHVLATSLDTTHCATLSKTILQNHLRPQFDGVIISDSLVMEGVLKQYNTVSDVAIAALDAGCDLLILGGRHLHGASKELSPDDVITIHKDIVDAVRTHRLDPSQIDRSFERILKLKQPGQTYLSLNTEGSDPE
ncbi:MAG: glycoside hydrolase family 3 protein [Chlamydiia bacterium]|nr:glycoside hydrolase family 3 protein [Chlamydiia bacterium]